jgi:hypothetical protein
VSVQATYVPTLVWASQLTQRELDNSRDTHRPHPSTRELTTMRSEIHIAPDSLALAPSSRGAENLQASAGPDRATTTELVREPLGRFRRARADAHPAAGDNAAQDEIALKLQVMLLSEENARLKAERHRPSDIGTLIDQMRELGDQEGPGEVLDEAWTMLSECLVIRQGLEQACAEIQAAIAGVRQRLGSLTIRLDDVTSADRGQPDVVPRQTSNAR